MVHLDAHRAQVADPGEKGLKGGALGLISSVVIGVASTAPAYSLAATLGFVVVAIGLQAPIVTIVAFIPMYFIGVGSNIMSAVPLLGQKTRFLMLGGNTVNANALLRFYVLHCVILPLVAAVLIAIHFWRIRKDGGLHTEKAGTHE